MLKIQTNATFPQAFHSQTLPFMATRIGTFRMDLGMIFDQPGTEPPPHPTLPAVIETPLRGQGKRTRWAPSPVY